MICTSLDMCKSNGLVNCFYFGWSCFDIYIYFQITPPHLEKIHPQPLLGFKNNNHSDSISVRRHSIWSRLRIQFNHSKKLTTGKGTLRTHRVSGILFMPRYGQPVIKLVFFLEPRAGQGEKECKTAFGCASFEMSFRCWSGSKSRARGDRPSADRESCILGCMRSI